MRIKKLPNALVVHLKRFKYIESYQSHKKLNYRVVFPFELKLCNTVCYFYFLSYSKYFSNLLINFLLIIVR